MGKQSKYDTGSTHEFMTAIKNAVVDLGGDDTDLQRVHKEPKLAEAIACVILHIDVPTRLGFEDIIRYAPNPEIRLRALTNIHTPEHRQAFLQRVVYDDADPRVRLAAAKLITNEKYLREIAAQTNDMSVGITVTGRINDPGDLCVIALKNPTHVPVMEILNNRIRNTDAMTEFVIFCENVETALIALEKVTDTVALLTIGERATISAVREQARRRCAGRV